MLLLIHFYYVARYKIFCHRPINSTTIGLTATKFEIARTELRISDSASGNRARMQNMNLQASLKAKGTHWYAVKKSSVT